MCINDDWFYQSIYSFEPTNTLSSVCTRKFCIFQSWLDPLKSDHVLIVGGTTPAEMVKEYWKSAVEITFLDIVSSELKSRFSHEKQAYYELVCPRASGNEQKR